MAFTQPGSFLEGWWREENWPWIGTILASRAINTLEHGPYTLALEIEDSQVDSIWG